MLSKREEHTCIFQIVGHGVATVRGSLESQKIFEFLHCFRRQYFRGELAKVVTSLSRRLILDWNIKVLFLVLEQLIGYITSNLVILVGYGADIRQD